MHLQMMTEVWFYHPNDIMEAADWHVIELRNPPHACYVTHPQFAYIHEL